PTTYLVDTTLSNSSDSDQTVQAVRLLSEMQQQRLHPIRGLHTTLAVHSMSFRKNVYKHTEIHNKISEA
ncbi:hypothetical protein, partial [Escherichia coli]|uniref:hypothetical protein n=1 Tax=Escherichia coli TaxID=562 RepID=UPI001962B763